MGLLGFGALLVLGYPFFAAWLVGRGSAHRLQTLQREVDVLRQRIAQLGNMPPAAGAATPAPARQEDESQARASPQPASRGESVTAATAAAPPDAPGTDGAPSGARPPAPVRVVETRTQISAVAKTPEPAPAWHAVDAPLQQATEAASATSNVTRPNPAAPKARPRWLVAVRNWLLTGNLVAKLGLVILFIGVAFLLKYVAATIDIPIELRLAGVVLADLGLLAWGWRVRTGRREIGLPVQGTAIAILMLVIFGAYQRYDLIPVAFAFTLLVALTAFTCLLAVLQDAVWLAAFGITGGFACPLLLSTGQGSHIGLFTYYALLNAGVFGIALKRAWRVLNLLGFAFTFVVASAWGGLKYTPANYLSAQLFLILFFLFYVGIALAFARQQQTRLKNYVDATLVLGTPLLGFGLQAGLVKDKPFGLAFSSLALGAFYVLLGSALWRQSRERWRVLIEAFVALGVIFGTLAIPFALDARWTSGAWALEGAGFVWYGLRHDQRRTWLFGLLLQAGAGLAFFTGAGGLDHQAAPGAHLWLGFLLLAGSTFAAAVNFRSRTGADAPLGGQMSTWLIWVAGLWLLAGMWTEAVVRTSGATLGNLLVAAAVLTAGLSYLIGSRMAWSTARVMAIAAQLAGAVAVLVACGSGWTWFSMLEEDAERPLLGIAMLALAGLVSARLVHRAAPSGIDKRLAPFLMLWGGMWWFGPFINVAAGRLAPHLPTALGALYPRWWLIYALAVAVSALACAHLARRLQWPALGWLAASCWAMLALVTCGAVLMLYDLSMPAPGLWLAWAVLWGTGERLLGRWMSSEPQPHRISLQALHVVRTGGPWLALWPAGSLLVDRWLYGATMDGTMVPLGSWAASSAWGNYVPTWAMMLVVVWLARRSRVSGWPVAPLADWYRAVVMPCATVLLLALVVAWNLGQDGTMAPLPYLPLLNPLDLTTGFALMLAVHVFGPLATAAADPARLRERLRVAGAAGAWVWLNLILLRSAAHYLGLDYRLDALAPSWSVQAMLSLVWSASALVMMRFAARRRMRRTWNTGAGLLGIVVLKLFLVDLANGGSMARVVSFVGVGLLMVLVGYFAPYPKANEDASPPAAGT